VVQRRRHNGYKIIKGTEGKVEEMGSLPSNWSAQTCELYALNQVLKLLQTQDMHMEWYTLLEKFGKKEVE